LLQLAAHKKQSIRTYDFVTAFLQGDEYKTDEEKVLLRLPSLLLEGPFGFSKTSIGRCRKSLYGLVDAPACWSRKVMGVLKRVGFMPSSTRGERRGQRIQS
jgi:hypothetical protein